MNNDRLVALKNEILMSIKVNEEELEPIVSESVMRYTGEFIPPFGSDWDIILNEVYPIVQYNLPSTFFRNPRAFLKPRNKTYITRQRDPVSGEWKSVTRDSTKSARTQEHILNYLISEIGYKKQVRKVLLDSFLFPYGVLWHGYKGEFGMTEEQSIEIKKERVFVKRISPLRFIHDPSVSISNLDEGKWVGRIIDIPLIDLLEDDKLDIDKNLIKGKQGYGTKIGRKTLEKQRMDIHPTPGIKKGLIDFADEEFKNSRAARFVRLYEIFLRPTKKEKRKGKNGFILLLTDEQKKPLRVNDWKIKAEGWPSLILEFNELPDHIFGMPDIDSYKQIADQKNVITNLQIRNAQEQTKVWVGLNKAGMDEETIESVQKGDNTIVLFETDNIRNNMFVASPGGASSSELYLIDQRIQRNLEDKSGVTDLKRGFLQSGEESAASVKLRNMGGSARPAYRQDIMSDFLKSSLLYLNQLNKQFVTIEEAVRIMGTLDIEWSEKPTKEDLQADVDVEIDVISMLPENPEKELKELNTVLVLMFQALTQPSVMTKIQQEGKTFNISPLFEQMLLRMRIRDPEIFRNIQPEESMGFVSVQQLREAEANVQAAIQGQQVPHPPKMEDDHKAKLALYTSASQIFKQMGQMSDMLERLIQIHGAMIQELQKKDIKPGQVIKLKKPSLETF